MSRQYNKGIKRARREAYLKRRKAAAALAMKAGKAAKAAKPSRKS